MDPEDVTPFIKITGAAIVSAIVFILGYASYVAHVSIPSF